MSKLFRKEAEEHTTTIDRTDEMIQIITPPGWIVLTGMIILILSVLIWSFLGNLTTYVNAQGIIINKGGLFNIISKGNGQITKIFVKKDDFVKEGDLIAVIDQPELSEKLYYAKEQLADAKEEYAEAKTNAEKRIELKEKYLRSQLENTKLIRTELISRKKIVEQQLTILNNNTEKIELTAEKENLLSEIEKTEAHIIDIDFQLFDLHSQIQSNLRNFENRVETAIQNSKLLENQLKIKSNVLSSFTGNILQIKVYEGANIREGMPVASVQSSNKDIQVILFVSPFEGNKIKKGMDVQIVPSNIKQEEYGFLLGSVESVSKFPLSNQAIKTVIDNDAIINIFTKSGPPIVISVSLLKEGESEYRWSSENGASLEINPGTLCGANISVANQKPITLVFPQLNTL